MAIDIFLNISKIKCSQTIIFVQLIQHNMGNIFLEIPLQNVVKKVSQILFLKIKIEHISGSIGFTQFVLIICQVEGYQKMLKLNCRPLVSTSYKASPKQGKRSETIASIALVIFY